VRYLWINLLVLTLFCFNKSIFGFIHTLPNWNQDNDVVTPKPRKIPSRCVPTIEFYSVHNKGKYGPKYSGDKPLSTYAQWDYLITNGKATNDDRIIMNAMSVNEGNLDSLNAYDNQAVSLGAMQKTIDPTGSGEFPLQVLQFKAEHPIHYEVLFEDQGWDVQPIKREAFMSYNGQTGKGLRTLLREGFTTAKVKNKSLPLGALVCAIRHPLFQMKQVLDFVSRLHDKVLPIVPTGFKPYKLSDYLKSNFGKAVALDHHVNRKSYVAYDFGKALQHLMSQHKGLSKNPGEWGAKRDQYEKEVVLYYGKIRRMTDPEGRLKRLEAKFKN